MYTIVNFSLMGAMTIKHGAMYFQFYFAIMLMSMLGPIASLIVCKNIVDFLKLLQKYEKLLRMIKNILQVFPEGVIIRSINSSDASALVAFVNNTAKDDFGKSITLDDTSNKNIMIDEAESNEHEFILRDPNAVENNLNVDSEATVHLKNVMQASENRLIDSGLSEIESQVEMVHQNDDDTSELGSKYFTVKTLKVAWENHENAYMHVFVSTTDVKRLEKEKATNK